ncbi:TetR/AcrR family transcriptional regulator [Streptomyces graminofaciens]|uniref:TetR/AcrR family transcriptional regulator n=1 Tax=Streptomyces graminofaciens TaxID=68212 RepID=UPI003D9B41CA
MAGMSASRPYHHGNLRAVLLESAERALREKGADALSLRELARDANVSPRAPVRHFKDKQALLNALVLMGYERLGHALQAADDRDAPLELRLATLAQAYLGFAVDNSELLELMYARKHDPDASEQMTAAIDRTMGGLRRVITEAQKRGEIIEGDPERLTLVVAAGLHGVAALTVNGALTRQAGMDGARDVVHHLLRGLTPG